jgi:uncharacterized protein YceK
MSHLKLLLLVFFLFFISIYFSGCGTILWGTKQKVKINSSVNNTTYIIKDFGNHVICEGNVPAKIKLKRKGSYIVYLDTPGYKKQREFITTSTGLGVGSASFFLNITNLWIGMIVDVATGATDTISNKEINAELKK